MNQQELSCALVGCGPMGAAAALELLRPHDGPPVRLLLVDRDAERVRGLMAMLDAAAGENGRPVDVVAHVGDAAGADTRKLILGYGIVATALSWADAREVTRFAVRNGLPAIGVGRPPADPRDELAEAGGAPFIAGAGLEPGLTEIIARRLAAAFDPGLRLRLYCGGVPRRPRPPMRHVSWYGPRLTISPRPTHRMVSGGLEQIERFSGVELVDVPGVGVLEAFHDGMLPWIGKDPVLTRVSDMSQKTLRWPGFSARVRFLDELGLLSECPVATPDGAVRPRTLLDSLLRPHIERRPDDEDVTILAAEATGTIAGRPAVRSTAVVASTDSRFGTTGLGRLTGGVLAGAIRLLVGHGTHDAADARLPAGVIHAHEAFTGDCADALLDSLRGGGVLVTDGSQPWARRVRSGKCPREGPDEPG
jgi:saccharopine dehydrogenase-like NADP-dependent oxidoreductase